MRIFNTTGPFLQIGSGEKDRFVIDGHLQMENILRRFVTVFDEAAGVMAGKSPLRNPT